MSRLVNTALGFALLSMMFTGLGGWSADADMLAAAKPPKPPVQLTWMPQRMPDPYKWQAATDAAAAHVEEVGGVVYDDWRLPTAAEIQAAIADGTFGQYGDGAGTRSAWTSQRSGNWATVVRFVTDENGVPIPALSGATDKVWIGEQPGSNPGSTLWCKFVRP